MAQVQQQQQQAAEPHGFIDSPVVQGGGLVTAILSIGAGIMWFRKRMSDDRLDVDKNRAEGNLLEVMRKERDAAVMEAKEAWARRAQDAENIGRLSAEVDGLRQLNQKTNEELELLRRLNEKQDNEIKDLRREFEAMVGQLKTCAICPLRQKEMA